MLWSGLRGRRWPVAVQLALALGLAGVAGLGFSRLGFVPAIAVMLVISVALGGFVDLPLTRIPSHGGPVRLGLNLGGALIPLAIAGQQAARLPRSSWAAAAVMILAVAALCFSTARPISTRGVFVPWLPPGMLAASLALVLDPACAPGLAFLAAVVGSFLGADLLTLSTVARLGAFRAVFGGAGPFDGLLWTGLVAAILTGPGK